VYVNHVEMPLTILATQLALNVLEMVTLPKQPKKYPNYSRKTKMPYTLQQHKLFEAAAHDPKVAKRTGIPVEKAKEMAHEGVKKDPKKLAMALMTK
jgi:hypothetical protein